MLNLICDEAVAAARNHLAFCSKDKETLFVVPDELSAAALTREICGYESGISGDQQIIAFEVLFHRLTANLVISGETIISNNMSRAMVRNIIDTSPESYDYLVGKNSVPRMSQGVLERIVSSIDRVRNKVASDDEAVFSSPRGRQLKLLASKMDERLGAEGMRLEKYALMEAFTRLRQDDWKGHFPRISKVVFVDFTDYSDIIFLLIAALTRMVKRCDVLLDFDPEDERHAQSAMEAAYVRLFDMADSFALTPDDLDGDGAAPNSAVPSPAPQAVVVTATTVAEEISAAVAVIRKLLSDAEGAQPPSIVVALPNWHEYAPALEKQLEESEIHAVWEQTDSPVRGGECLLLDRLRQCCGRVVDGTALSSLFRAPGFYCLLNNGLTVVEAWNLASRLDYILTLTGRLQGWKAIQASVQGVLKRLQKERRRNGQWTEEEEILDAALLTLLKSSQDILKTFTKKASVADWCRETAVLFGRFPSDTRHFSGQPRKDFRLERLLELKRTLRKMASAGKIISPQDVDFGYFVSLLRTALYNVRLDNLVEMQTVPVSVCSPSVAAKMRSDCCIVLGCNDGNFPRFARPDASFLNYSFQSNQTGFRARQWVTLECILRNHNRILLWMPSKAGTDDLLPSQFIEDLLDSERCPEIKTAQLLERMKIEPNTKNCLDTVELINNIKGIILTEGELKRFRQRGSLAYNIAANISVLASRSNARMAGYDGIILDPNLQTWLAAWADRHIYSVSQLDAVVGCSFRFFLQRMLNLEELDEADDLLPAHVFGSFTHDVLARFYRDWVAGGCDVPRFDDERLAREKLLNAYQAEHDHFSDLSDFARDLLNLKLFGEFGPEKFGNNMRPLSSVKDPGVFGQFLLMEMKRGDDPVTGFLKPANFEVGFGMGRLEEDDPLSLPEHLELDLGKGERIKLRGRIDRIDLSLTGVFAVTDYKTGRIPEKRDILGGYRTQLPVYMLVAEQLLKTKFAEPEPAGGLYYSLKKGNDVKVSGIFFRSTYQQEAGVTGRSCLTDDEFDATLDRVKNLMQRSLKAVKRGYLTTTRHNPEAVCRYCPFEGFCYRDVDRTEIFWQAVDSGNVEELV